MREDLLRKLYEERGADPETTERAVACVREFEEWAGGRGLSAEALAAEDMAAYVESLVSEGRNTPDRFQALTRHSYLAGQNELYLYLVSLFGGSGVVESMAQRAEEIAGVETRTRVFDSLEMPPLGSPQSAYPRVVRALVEGLTKHLPDETCRRVLAGNHHRLPEEAYLPLREKLLSEGIDTVLRHRHQNLVAELERHAQSGQPWFEQIITPEVVDYVKGNPEMSAGVREGDTIYVTKIPFAPADYLRETDPIMKRYYLCHCTLARASILSGPPVSPLFCYCSAGFTKFPFDVAYGEPLEVEVLESVLAGDPRCRFAIKIPTPTPR